jgi:acetoin utilization protein AcuB
MPRSSVRELMTRQPVTLFEDDRLREAVELVTLHHVRHIPVLSRQGRVVGIVTDRDIKQTLPSPLSSAAPEEYEALLETTPLGRVMSRNPLTVEPESDVADAVEILVSRKIGGLPVVHDGVLVGIFTERDALRGYLRLLKA